ncbi:MAG: hypothetical protein ACK4VO_08200 [Pseudobdellovibrio sp.]
MERFLIGGFFILTLVFLSDNDLQSEYKRDKVKDEKNSVSEQGPLDQVKEREKIFYPPFKKKPFVRTTWKA